METNHSSESNVSNAGISARAEALEKLEEAKATAPEKKIEEKDPEADTSKADTGKAAAEKVEADKKAATKKEKLKGYETLGLVAVSIAAGIVLAPAAGSAVGSVGGALIKMQ